MLDFDLAALYGIETKVLKQAVRRNIERFEGEDFMFELTEKEYNSLKISLRSQIVTLNTGRGSNFKYAPWAFGELGVAMLSSVLRSAKAIEINRNIMRAFVTMRQYITSTRQITTELEVIREKIKQLEHGSEDTIEAVNDLSEDMCKELDNIYLEHIWNLSSSFFSPPVGAFFTHLSRHRNHYASFGWQKNHSTGIKNPFDHKIQISS